MNAGSRMLVRILVPACAVAILSSCVTPPAPSPTPAEGAAARVPTARSFEYLRIDPTRSSLAILVYRGGTLARFGHNHVVEARALQGFVRHAEPLEASYVELAFRVEDLVVDDPAARAAAGADFAGIPPPEAIAGTRRNMLGAALLAAADHPTILVRSLAVTPTPAGATLLLEARVKERIGTFAVPLAIEVRDGELEVSGEAEVSQRALGLEPFSAMLGALEVLDGLVVRFRAVAVR